MFEYNIIHQVFLPHSDYTYPDSVNDMMGEAAEDPPHPSDNETAASGMADLRPSDCHISLMVMGYDVTVSVLTINAANMERSANFTCLGWNGVENRVGSPENATVELILIGEQFIYCQDYDQSPSQYFLLKLALSYMHVTSH